MFIMIARKRTVCFRQDTAIPKSTLLLQTHTRSNLWLVFLLPEKNQRHRLLRLATTGPFPHSKHWPFKMSIWSNECVPRQNEGRNLVRWQTVVPKKKKSSVGRDFHSTVARTQTKCFRQCQFTRCCIPFWALACKENLLSNVNKGWCGGWGRSHAWDY